LADKRITNKLNKGTKFVKSGPQSKEKTTPLNYIVGRINEILMHITTQY